MPANAKPRPFQTKTIPQPLSKVVDLREHQLHGRKVCLNENTSDVRLPILRPHPLLRSTQRSPSKWVPVLVHSKGYGVAWSCKAWRLCSEGALADGGEVPVASTKFSNCGRGVDGLDAGILTNSAIEVGPVTQWCLPSGGGLCMEGTRESLAASGQYNQSATLFKPGQLPPPRDHRSGAGSMLLIGHDLSANVGLGVERPLTGLYPERPQVWVLINSKFSTTAPTVPIFFLRLNH